MGKLQHLGKGKEGAELAIQNDASLVCFLDGFSGLAWARAQGSSQAGRAEAPTGRALQRPSVPPSAFLYPQQTFAKCSLSLFPSV